MSTENQKNTQLQFEDLEEVQIEITPVVELSEVSDAQDLPETGASIGQTGCCSYRSSKAN